jgi:hypothetical protein
MINHARTLLLNKSSANYMPGSLGEEYIPPGYVAVALPTHINTARKILFGANPDQEFVNFRLYELLSLIHNTELAEFVYALDPRVTYWPRHVTDFYQAQKNVIVEKISGSVDTFLYINGDPEANIRTGVLSGDYIVRLLTRDGGVRVVINQTGRAEVVEQSIDTPEQTIGLTPPIPLPNSPIIAQLSDYVNPLRYLLLEDFAVPENFLLQENAEKIELESATVPEIAELRQRVAAMSADTVLASWRVQVYARPEAAVTACLPRLELIGEPAFLQLFGVGAPPEPFATFKNIWFDAKDPSYRLAAFTLALIYRTEALRHAG